MAESFKLNNADFPPLLFFLPLSLFHTFLHLLNRLLLLPISSVSWILQGDFYLNLYVILLNRVSLILFVTFQQNTTIVFLQILSDVWTCCCKCTFCISAWVSPFSCRWIRYLSSSCFFCSKSHFFDCWHCLFFKCL